MRRPRRGALRAGLRRGRARLARPRSAELAKLLENIFRAVNIALVNELALLTDRMGIDIWEVIDAASTKPYGFMRFEPGPGHGRPLPAGRPVLPRLARARVRHAGSSSSSSPASSTSRCPTTASRSSSGRSTTRGAAVRGARIAVLGVSYKPGVGDVRESPALKIIDAAARAGRRGRLPRPARAPRCEPSACARSRSTTRSRDADLALIVTAHPGSTTTRRPRAACSSTCAGSRARWGSPGRCGCRGRRHSTRSAAFRCAPSVPARSYCRGLPLTDPRSPRAGAAPLCARASAAVGRSGISQVAARRRVPRRRPLCPCRARGSRFVRVVRSGRSAR